jgi:hypothetical protein
LLTLTAGLLLMGFIVFLFYSSNYVSPLYIEKIILGKAQTDPLFFSSLSNMFSTLGWVSTGVDGSPYINYHYGSMALFAGLKNWIGLNSLMFYNIAFPAIFIPLFFKTLFYFLSNLSIYKKISPFNVLFAIAFLIILYSLKLAGFDYATPLRSESATLSFILTFLFASNLLSYINKLDHNHTLFFIYSAVILLIISSVKISTGVVCISGMAYLFLRTHYNFKNLLLVLVTGLLTAGFIYLFIFPIDRPTISVSLAFRIRNLWIDAGTFITYLLGACIAMIIILKNKPIENWSDIKLVIRSKEYLDLEVLFILTITGFLGAIIASSNRSDVYNLCDTQFFISIPFLILFGQKYFDQFVASRKVKTLFLFLLIFLSIVSRPDLSIFIFDITSIKKEILTLSQQQQILQDFITELFRLEKVSDKKTKCLYIPQTEKWYYESQSSNTSVLSPMGSPFLAPAISGIAMIGGIPDFIIKSDFVYYGYYYYRKNGQLMAGNNIDIKNRALLKGYGELIEYKVVEGKLNKQTFDLKQKIISE